jgi:hypothetical protein
MEVINRVKKVIEADVITDRYNLCDKCDNVITQPRFYDVFECVVKRITGSNYIEGGSGDIDKVELCEKCAEELFELLKKNRYRIVKSEWESEGELPKIPD